MQYAYSKSTVMSVLPITLCQRLFIVQVHQPLFQFGDTLNRELVVYILLDINMVGEIFFSIFDTYDISRSSNM